jgi:hypothetical protein
VFGPPDENTALDAASLPKRLTEEYQEWRTMSYLPLEEEDDQYLRMCANEVRQCLFLSGRRAAHEYRTSCLEGEAAWPLTEDVQEGRETVPLLV